MVQTSDYGQFTFGPAVDDLLVPAPLSLLLARGFYWPEFQIMVADNTNEGLLFTPPTVQSDSDFKALIFKRLPGLSFENLEKVVKMYPVDDNFTPKQRVQRVANAISELAVVCNTQYVIKAFGGSRDGLCLYNYKFGIYPGFHGQDTFFTVSILYPFQSTLAFVLYMEISESMLTQSLWQYYEPPFASDAESIGNFSRVTAGTEGVAMSLQGYLTSFAMYRNPNVAGLGPTWSSVDYGILNITSTDGPGGPIDQIGNITWVEGYYQDSGLKERCDWWEKAPYWDFKNEFLKTEL